MVRSLHRNAFTLIAAGALLLGGAAQAAPVATNIIVGISFEGSSGLFVVEGAITFSGAGTVSVSGSTVSLAAGAVSLPAPVIIPVTATTAGSSITAMTVSNQAGTFSVGGVTAQARGEICRGAPAAGTACNAGGGVGGIMGLSGFINVLPFRGAPVIIPVDLNAALLGQGGATNSPFTFEAAAFSTGIGLLNTGVNVISTSGSPGPLTLVSPTYVSALGTQIPFFTSITFTNVSLPVPEPVNLLLIGSGLVGIMVLVTRRSRDDA